LIASRRSTRTRVARPSSRAASPTLSEEPVALLCSSSTTRSRPFSSDQGQTHLHTADITALFKSDMSDTGLELHAYLFSFNPTFKICKFLLTIVLVCIKSICYIYFFSNYCLYKRAPNIKYILYGYSIIECNPHNSLIFK
jgi:hypothetical protein